MEATALPVYFGEWLKRRRKALDLTQVELAQRAGCSVFALRKIESGERRPSKQLAGLLAQSLEIPSEDHPTFIRVARGELNLERLRPPGSAHMPVLTPASKPRSLANNLPVMPTPLVGREPELAALSRLLNDAQCRLLTLVGPGGVGKTRLAIEAAGPQSDQFTHGVYFVPLAGLSSPDYLLPAIAGAVGYVFQGKLEPRIQLLNYLVTKQALLVLDNLEHLLDGVELFAEMLKCAPGVKLLITSRERLNLQSEWVFEVQGLPVPVTSQVKHPEAYSSLALFVQCARRAKADFELRGGDLLPVVRICQMVEGLPLGIELAAVWVSALKCQEIAHEIERGMDFLATSMRDAPERQRSLRAAFDHSWNLLSQDERDALSQLAVFQGGFERQAAEVVAGATPPTLLALVSKSLVRREESGRYGLHEIIRQYARAHLSESAQSEATLDRHSDFYLSLLRDRENDLKGAAQRKALRELKREIDNVRAAWSWAVQRGNFISIGEALRSFALLSDLGGWLDQGSGQLENVVQALRAVSENEQQLKVLGQALTQQGDLLFRQGKFDQALTRLEESLAILRPIGDPTVLAGPLIFSSVISHLNGEIERSQALMVEGLENAQAAGDPWFTAYGIFNQGYLASLVGRYAEGYQQMLAGIAGWRALGDPRYTALGLNFISRTAIKLGYHAEAQAFLQESLDLCEQVGDRWGIGTAYRYLGLAALVQGDPNEAQYLIHKSLDIFSGVTSGWDIVQSLVFLGEAAALSGDSSKAKRIFLDALNQASEAQTVLLAIEALIGLAHLQARAGDCDQALELSIFVLNHPACTQESKERADQLRVEIEADLTAGQIESAHKQAQTKSLEVLVEELLAVS